MLGRRSHHFKNTINHLKRHILMEEITHKLHTYPGWFPPFYRIKQPGLS